MYNYFFFFNLRATWWVGGQRQAPAALPLVKTRYPLYRGLGGPLGMHIKHACFVRSQITKKIYIYKYFSYFRNYIQYCADPSGQAGLRPLACWDYGFESRRGHMSVPCECCVLSGRSLCVGLITFPEDPYRV